jgi:hypothetical protein
VPDHLRAADAAERPQRGHEINRFKDVRLALRVVAEQQVEARRKVGVQPRVIAEVPESQMGQMHAGKMNWKGNRREFFRVSRNEPTSLKMVWIRINRSYFLRWKGILSTETHPCCKS